MPYNVHRPDDVHVKVDDLKPGDLVVAVYRPASKTQFDPWEKEWVFVSLQNRGGYVEMVVSNHTIAIGLGSVNEVWIRARKDDGIEVGPDGILVGDEITAWATYAPLPKGQLSWTVTKVVRKPGGGVTEFHASRTAAGPGAKSDVFWSIGNGPIRLRVKRAGSSTAQAPAPTKKVIDPYPDFCTRCGAPAYVGLFEVAHKNEAAAADCPARRK